MTIKGTYPESNQGNFKVVDTIGVPHPYCITDKHVAYASDHCNGILGHEAIREAEEHGAVCGICQKQGKILTIDEHKEGLLVECKTDIKPVPAELQEWLLLIRAETEKNGYTGFAFKQYAPPKPARVWHNYQIPPTCKLGDPGAGCFLEPPDHPTYFVQFIYTSAGNSPPRPPYYYLNGNGYDQLEDIEHLYKPLPYDSPRVKAWEDHLYSHLRNCYQDASKEDKTLIFPVPYYELKRFIDDTRFSDEWRAKAKAEVDQANIEIIKHADDIAKPENHKAYLSVKKYYPEATPRLDLIADPPKSAPDWYARCKEKPTPETCQGESFAKHPVNGKWCQVCGWHEGD